MRRAPSKPASVPMGAILVAPFWRAGGTTITALALVACVSSGSPPPSPSDEAVSKSQTQRPVAAPTSPTSTASETEPPAGSSPPAPVADLKRELSALPDSVLVGTDVVPLAGYLGSTSAIPPSGTFRSEQGGATAKVHLAPGPQGPTLTREFAEPGTKAQTKRYDALQRRANGARLSGTTLEVLGTVDALLVLEKRSGVDGIPDSLWIEYGVAPAGAAVEGE
jgi:hypothetical protein